MSNMDLTTVATHRRTELQERINKFSEKCDRVINDIDNFKTKAQGLVNNLNCEKSALKERFLSSMKILDEYMYLMTEFHIAYIDIDLSNPLPDEPEPCSLPEQKSLEPNCVYTGIIMHVDMESFWVIIDDLNEVYRLIAQMTEYYTKTRTNLSRDEIQSLTYCAISFDEYFYRGMFIGIDQNNSSMAKIFSVDTGEILCVPFSDIQQLNPNFCNKPPYAHCFCLAGVDLKKYDNTELVKGVTDFIKQYMNQFCSFQVVKDSAGLRDVYVTLSNNETLNDIVNKALADGNIQNLSAKAMKETQCLKEKEESQPLVIKEEPQCIKEEEFQPLVINEEPQCIQQEDPQPLIIKEEPQCIEEEESQPLVLKEQPQCIKDEESQPLVINEEPQCQEEEESQPLVIKEQPQCKKEKESQPLTPEAPELEEEIDITQCPEYEDPLVATTGHHNRDEKDICKHYKGGPAKTCFKGTRCKKRHVMKHPDGWTSDRIEVVGKYRNLPLPQPGTWHEVQVTFVCHFDRVFVQFIRDKENERQPRFGEVLIPMTLTSLIRDMNDPAAVQAYKNFKVCPAVGEMVAALYPCDNKWYRARIIEITRFNQNLQVMYIDYGTTIWIKEDKVRILDEQYLLLPAQAVRCKLAGITVPSTNSQVWAKAKAVISEILQNKLLNAHIIARDYDELTVELHDGQGCITDLLANNNDFEILDYEVEHDTNITQKIVVP